MTNSKEEKLVDPALQTALEQPQSSITFTLDQEKATEVHTSCVTLFTQMLQDKDEDHALANIVAASLLIYESFRLDTPVACGKGCSYCCHQPVGLNVAEARTIALHLPSLPDDIRKDSLKRLKRLVNVPPKKYGPTHHNKKYACPFLHEDGSCRIYEVRPLSCRRYTSISVETCMAVLEGDVSAYSKLTQIPIYRIVADLITKAVADALKKHADEGRVVRPEYEMVSAVYYLVKERGIV